MRSRAAAFVLIALGVALIGAGVWYGALLARSSRASAPQSPRSVGPGARAEADAALPAPGFVLSEAHGDVQVATGADFAAAAPGDGGLALGGGTRIRTGRGSSAVLRAPDGSEVALADGVEISIAELSAQVARFALERGKVRAASPEGGRAVTVDSSGARAEAQGARFVIYTSPRGLVAVASESGRVKLRAQGREVEVPAGQQSIVPPQGMPTDPVAVPDAVFLQVAWPGETLQREPETLVRGRARPGERVYVNGAETEVAMDGTFMARVHLREGKNPPLRVEAEALTGRRRILRGPAVEVKSDLDLQVRPVDWGARKQ
ncbi:MAG TPA: FecR domain-containing protein [Polyangia bacterium]|nr:FecR domain-containing protein [Polyangia bacterium]